jgi:hypothetical protein
VTARTEDGILMALQHRELPLVGLQFHPEAVLTDAGYLLLANFLRMAGVEPAQVPEVSEERPEHPFEQLQTPHGPVTF